jgi:transcriptional regulator with XRE-family HTH domain
MMSIRIPEELLEAEASRLIEGAKESLLFARDESGISSIDVAKRLGLSGELISGVEDIFSASSDISLSALAGAALAINAKAWVIITPKIMLCLDCREERERISIDHDRCEECEKASIRGLRERLLGLVDDYKKRNNPADRLTDSLARAIIEECEGEPPTPSETGGHDERI